MITTYEERTLKRLQWPLFHWKKYFPCVHFEKTKVQVFILVYLIVHIFKNVIVNFILNFISPHISYINNKNIPIRLYYIIIIIMLCAK